MCAVALAWAGATAAPTATREQSDTGLADFAFASELGSGIYRIGAQTLQVYQLSPGYRLRYAERPGKRPGLRLLFPVTLGFLDFTSQDLVHFDLPTHVGALSFEPGVQLDYWLDEDWHVYLYIKAGATFASSTQVNAYIYGAGVRSDYHFSVLQGAGLWRAELTYAGVHYRGTLVASIPRDDSFTRLRNGAELRHGFGAPFQERRWELGVYGIADVYLNAPTGPETGVSSRTLQLEGGLMLGLNPMYQLWGVAIPRIGIGYREAGVLSGWRLVFGEPF